MLSRGSMAAAILLVVLLGAAPGYGQENCFQDEQDAAACEDSDKFCIDWAQEGQCKSNASWMLINCRKACGSCNDKLGLEDFNMAVFREVALNSPKSVFMSPYSIWSAFLMTYFGSHGVSKEQLRAALGVKGKMDAHKEWKLLDFFIEKPYQQTGTIFRSLNKAYFDKDIPLKKCISKLIYNLEEVNFANKTNTARIINDEVRKTTEGMIPKLIKPRDLNGANFLLLNAVYFKGKWESTFDPKETEMKEFKNDQDKVLGKVEMMHDRQRQVQHVRYDPIGAEFAEIPYDNSSISMILIKPYKNEATLDSVLSNLTSDILQDAMNQMKIGTFWFGLPKFRMETRIEDDLVKAMTALGVSEIFSGRADLSGFSDKHVKVDTVIHEAVVEVTEEGTRAAAATAIIPTRLGYPGLVMNRPFIYLIHDKSANITLFAGTFRNPVDIKPIPRLIKAILN